MDFIIIHLNLNRQIKNLIQIKIEIISQDFKKTIEAEKNGYRLIHIEEYEWKSNKQKIIDLLQSIINQKYQFKLENNIEIIDRSIFNKINICKGYKIIEEIPGKLIQIDKFHFYTCGYLVYKRLDIK